MLPVGTHDWDRFLTPGEIWLRTPARVLEAKGWVRTRQTGAVSIVPAHGLLGGS